MTRRGILAAARDQANTPDGREILAGLSGLAGLALLALALQAWIDWPAWAIVGGLVLVGLGPGWRLVLLTLWIGGWELGERERRPPGVVE